MHDPPPQDMIRRTQAMDTPNLVLNNVDTREHQPRANKHHNLTQPPPQQADQAWTPMVLFRILPRVGLEAQDTTATRAHPTPLLPLLIIDQERLLRRRYLSPTLVNRW